MRNFPKILAMLVLTAGVATGCGQTVNHRPLSAEEFAQTDFLALVPERFWGDALPPNLEEAIRSEGPVLRARFPEAVDATPETAPLAPLLAISGGGANGAFSAGLLAGWSESGQRPQFEVVTGVSTGAIIAPFAFLGPDYDPILLQIYGASSRDDIYLLNTWTESLFGSAFADTTPLKRQLETYVTPEVVEAIAAQTRLKRRLFIITTHFDALRPVVWDIGAIALRRGAEAAPLIRQIILASAAIPGFFPPVPIEWESDGKRFTELHVDGAVSRQVFAYPAQIPVGRINEILGLTFRRQIFVILNGNIQDTYEPAPVTTAPIVQRALTALLRNKSNADVEQIYYLAQRDGVDFGMIAIPEEFRADGSTEFDPDYMRELMQLGREIGRRGDFWLDRPASQGPEG